jgi:predicted short-subunit dehydrogenase-like oxidoreductase (DUF2520 family)
MPRNTVISFIGSGNVATHLGLVLNSEGYSIEHIWSRNQKRADTLATKIGATFCPDPKQFGKNSHLIIAAVNDDALPYLAEIFGFSNKLFVHTSGFGNSNALANMSSRFGVFYPLQSFSMSNEVNWHNVPILIESNLAEDQKLLGSIAENVSEKPIFVNEKQRKTAHLAAVFANNFTNILFASAEEILKKENLNLSLLQPLINLTASRVRFGSPLKYQTGPAVRNDVGTMQKHLDLLDENPELKEAYKLLSKLIKDKIDAKL